MGDVSLALVESDGDFENEEEVVAGGADASQNVGDPLRVGDGIVDGVAQFFDQPLEVIFEFQKSPERSVLTASRRFYGPRSNRVKINHLTTRPAISSQGAKPRERGRAGRIDVSAARP
jgi:hypothetical protein